MVGKDTDTVYGLRISKGRYEKQRMALYFESVESATQRNLKRNYLNLLMNYFAFFIFT